MFGASGAASTGTGSFVNVGTSVAIYNVQRVASATYVSSLGLTTPFIIGTISGSAASNNPVTPVFNASLVSPSLPSSYGTFVYNATEIYGTSASYIWKASTVDGATWTAITLNIATPANGITVRDINGVRTVFFTLESALYRTTEVNGAFTPAVALRTLNSGKARFHDVTTVPNACVDGEKNLAETDVDCGGSVCGKCDTGKACTLHTDCSSTYCAADTGLCSK